MFWFFGQLVDRQFSPEDRLPYIEAPRGEQARDGGGRPERSVVALG